MNTRLSALDLSRSSPWFIGLLLVAALAFWPTYLAGRIDYPAYTHFHAATATLWILMLIAQPWAIHRRKFALHRATGRLSYVIAPVVVIAIALAAHNRINLATPADYPLQSFILYLQLSIATVFAISYAFAIAYRREMAVHARFMICTALTLIDPIFIRIFFWLDPLPGFHYWWLTFGMTDAVLLALIWLERRAPAGRWVFPAMLPVFVLAQIPAVFQLTGGPLWQSFSRWYAALPLT